MLPPSNLRNLYPHGSLRHEAGGAGRLRTKPASVPWSKEDNYSPSIIASRRAFVEDFSGVALQHASQYSFDPQVTQGNIENFTGVVQMPLGFAGPLQVRGEHAKGEFLIPLATTEGTLVASYNRGMKVLNRSGGVLCTVQDDHMQRAPVFIFESAREAMAFRQWWRTTWTGSVGSPTPPPPGGT